MSDKLDATIGISADASGVEAGVGKAKKSLRSLGSSAKNVAQDVGSMGDGSDKAAKKVARDTKSMERSLQSLLAKLEGGSRESRGYWEKIAEFKGVDKNALSPLLNQLDSYQAKQKQAVEATKSFSDSINGLQKAFVSAGAAAAAAKFISVADSVTVLNNQLKLATGSTESAALAYESLFQIAQRSRVGFTELGETFASITRAAAPLGVSQERLLRVTESIGNAMTISGGSAQGLQAALVQLSQGLSAGALRGDELNSVMEQAPRLAKALADGLGVTTGQLRAMGAEGQITAEKVIGALESQAGVLRGEVAGAALTVGQAFVQLGNSATHAIGSLDKATGASASAASAISAIASAINGLGQAAANNEAAIKAVLSFGAVIAGAKLATVAVGGVTTAFAAARIAVLGFSAALAASPIGFALVAVAALGASAYSAAVAMDAAGESAKGLEGAAAAAAEASAKEFKALQTAAEKAGSELSKAEKKLADLESRGAKGSSNLMLREAYNHTQRLVNKLREAKRVQDDLLRGSLGGAYTEGMGNNSEIVRRREAEAALAKEIKDYLTADARQTRAQIREEEISKARLKNAALIAKAEGDTNTVLQLQAALKTEIANIESRYKDSAAPRIKGDASAYATLSKRVNEYISQLALEAKQGDKVTAAQKLQIQLDDLLINSKGKLTAANIADLQARIEIASAMEREAKAVKRNVEAYQEYIKDQEAIARADVELSKAKEALWKNIAEQNIELENQSRMLELEASNIGKSAYERTLANEVLKAQIELEKELRDISNNTEYDAAAKNEAEAAARARAVKKIALAERKAYVTEWEKTSQTIGDTLADYIMGGGKDAAQYLKRLFSTLVLQPIVQTAVGGIMGTGAAGVAGIASGGGGGGIGGLLNTASNIKTLMGLSGSGAALGSLGVSNAVGMAGGDALGALISTNATNWGVTAGSSMLGTIGAALPWIAGGLAIASLLGGDLFKKSTPHMGAAAVYKGGEVSRGWMPEGQFQEEMFTAIGGIAQSIGSALDATAESFGKKAGYTLSTVFSDDSSKDKAFGGLSIIGPDGQKIADWSGFDQKWGGKRFSDGEAGYKEYLAALTADVKTAFMAMDLPGWSDQLIEAATDLDSLNQALQGVSSIKASFDALGRSMEMFSGISGELQTVLLETAGSMDTLLAGANAFYQGFYSEQERMEALQKQLRDTLTGLDLSIDPAMGDEAKEQFRATVEAAMAGGQGELASQLLAMSGSFATAADAAQKSIQEMADAAAELAQNLRSSLISIEAQFSGGGFSRQYQAEDAAKAVQTLLGDVGISKDAGTLTQTLLSATTDEVESYFREIWGVLPTDEARQKLIGVAGSMLDLAAAADAAAKAVASEREGLEQRWLQAIGDTAEMRRRELEALDPSNRALLEMIYGLEDAKTSMTDLTAASQQAAQKAAAAWQNWGTAAGLGAQYLGDTSGLEARRAILGAQISASTDPANRLSKLQELISIEQAIGQAQQASRKTELEAINARQSALQKEISAAQQLLSAAQSLGDYAHSLQFGATSGLSDADRLAALSGEYSSLIGKARGGDAEALKQLQGVSEDYLSLAQTLAVSGSDYSVLSGRMAAEMEALAKGQELVAQSQVTGYEAQIAQLTQQSDLLSAQVELTDSTKSLIAKSMLDQAEVWDRENTQALTLQELQQRATDSLALMPDGIARALRPALDSSASYLASSIGSTVANALNSLAGMLGMDGSHATGLSYVPFDGYRAELHRGERVLTAAENRVYSAPQPFVMQTSNGTARLEALVEQQTQYIAKLESRLAVIEANTGGLYDLTDQKSEGGNADRVELMNVEPLAKAIAEKMKETA